MHKLSDRWFKEDRELYKGPELKEQKAESEKAIRNSTILIRRLRAMLEEDIEKTYLSEEQFDNPAWERIVLAAAAERKALRRVLNLLPS